MSISMKEDAPRPQHYHFAHHYLRERAQGNPKELVNTLSRETGTSYLSTLWVSLGLAFTDVQDSFIPAGGLGCFPVRINDAYHGVIVQFPQPERMTEAYFVAIIVKNSESKQISSEEQSAPCRYFTLEFSKNADGSKQTVLGEWEDGSHSYISDGVPPAIEGFVEAIHQLLEFPLDGIPLPPEIKQGLSEIARSFIGEGRTDYDELVREFEEWLGEELFDMVADHLPAIIAAEEKRAES